MFGIFDRLNIPKPIISSNLSGNVIGIDYLRLTIEFVILVSSSVTISIGDCPNVIGCIIGGSGDMTERIDRLNFAS